jgi:hypothetical protein
MSDTQARYHLGQLKRKYLLLRFCEVSLYALALGALAFFVQYAVGVPIPVSALFAVSGAVLIFFYHAERLHLFSLTESQVAFYLNQNFPVLQNSSDLLLQETTGLSNLQQLQKHKIAATFETMRTTIRFPHKIGPALMILLTSAMLSYTWLYFAPVYSPANPSTTSSVTSDTPLTNDAVIPPVVKTISLSISPPRYTGIRPSETTNPNLTIPEGSTVDWTFTFTDAVKNASLIFSGKDQISLSSNDSINFTVQKSLYQTGFYQLAWLDASGQLRHSDFYKIEITKDQAPDIAVHRLNQFTEMEFADKLLIDLNATLTDDYGLDSAHIIATVSKGSGESVKFREDKLFFEKPSVIQGKHLDAIRTLNLRKLGMEPGDELYFYIVAYDNRTPERNRTRTETYFISLRDTTQQETVIDDGLGVDLMPDYFRSQRQIIIDTEKLLREKKKTTADKFKSKSNELGYDQKVLRLRYGEFLGEEFESGIGPQNALPEEDHDHEEEEDVTKKYGHVHDTENEHNLVQEKPIGHQHNHEEHEGEDKNGIPKEYVHQHDSEEEATFFTMSIRAKLKAALTVMWDAELHLRLYEPEKSLPFQYKALKLLKEISQDSRIYVHRTGFDPPPIKEEKRMTGDLSEVKSTTAQALSLRSEGYPAIRRALTRVALYLAQPAVPMPSSLKKDLAGAGQELSALALQQPGQYLKSLSLIRSLTDTEMDATEQRGALLQIQRALYVAVPERQQSPAVSAQTLHALDKAFIENHRKHD